MKERFTEIFYLTYGDIIISKIDLNKFPEMIDQTKHIITNNEKNTYFDAKCIVQSAKYSNNGFCFHLNAL